MDHEPNTPYIYINSLNNVFCYVIFLKLYNKSLASWKDFAKQARTYYF